MPSFRLTLLAALTVACLLSPSAFAAPITLPLAHIAGRGASAARQHPECRLLGGEPLRTAEGEGYELREDH